VLLAVFVLLLVWSGTRYEEGHDWVADNLQKAVGQKNLMSPERLAVTFIVVVVIVAIFVVLWGMFVAPP
jgi:hypothetical protein